MQTLVVSTADGLFAGGTSNKSIGSSAKSVGSTLLADKENNTSHPPFISLHQGRSPKAIKLQGELLWVFDKQRLTIMNCSSADRKSIEFTDKSLDIVSICQYKGAVIVIAADSIDLWPGKLLTQLAAPLKSANTSKPSQFYSQLILQHRLHIVSRDSRKAHCAVVGDFLVLGEEQRMTIFNLVLKTKHSFKLESRKGESAINCIAGSHFKRSLIAVGWTDGTVQLVDVHLLSVVHTFAGCHAAPVSDLAFSPFNRFLLISVSLDKHFALFDVEQNSTVRSIATPFPLTCLGFKQDGVIIAIGTTTGSVLLYDLSSGAKTPLMTFDNFNKNLISRVDFLEFPVGWLNSGSQQTITSGSLTSTAATPQKLPNRGPAFVTTRRVPTIAAAALDPDQTMNYMEMFSPVAGGAVPNSRQVSPLGSVGSGELTAQTSQRSMPLFDALSIGSGKSEQPAKEADAPNSKSEVATPTPAFTRADSLPSLPISTQLPSIAERRPSKSADDLSLPSTRRSPVPSLATDTDDPPDQQQELAPLKIPPVTMSAAVNNAIETMEDSMAKQTTLAQEKFTKQLEVVADVNNGGYSSELLSSTLNDVLMDFRRQVRTDLNNIHVELLRQFETQQNQMQLMIQQSHERMLTAMHQLILGDFPGTTAKDVGK